MTASLRLPRALLETVLLDLERAHPFAAERVGFLSVRETSTSDGPLLLATEYHSIPDDDYLPDAMCGARIGEKPIQAAMARAFRTGEGQLWVHSHGRLGVPFPSPLDEQDGPRVAGSCRNANLRCSHGWAVLCESHVVGEVISASGAVVRLDRLSPVGWHDSRPRAATNRREDERYSRQDFLGPAAQPIIRSVRLGFVGLGGGGSHLVQQAAHIGVQEAIFCDAQRIERTNLNRLVGATVADVRRRRFKTAIAARVFRGLQPEARLDDRPLTWQDKIEALKACDLIFGALDGFAARRDLEAFCRRYLIPLVDVGMIVIRPPQRLPEIRGQVIASVPAGLCMHCLQFLTTKNLAEDTQRYDTTLEPQVVWSNGVLASTAMGMAMALLSGWSGAEHPLCRIDYQGSTLAMTPSNFVKALGDRPCPHFPLREIGNATFTPL
jgi:hypothetical protein